MEATAYLQVINGARAGTIWEINCPMLVLGRHPDNEIPVESPYAARRHAQILRIQGEFFLEDVQSRNGTFLNDERVRDRRKMVEGDRIRIGDVVFEFHDSPELPNAMLYHYCTRCGTQVESYSPSEALGHDEYWDYEIAIASDASIRPGDSAYLCQECQARWLAAGRQDTGWIRRCGHFMPCYAAFCRPFAAGFARNKDNNEPMTTLWTEEGRLTKEDASWANVEQAIDGYLAGYDWLYFELRFFTGR